MIVTEKGNLEILKFLLSNNANPNFIVNEEDNLTALIYAIQIV